MTGSLTLDEVLERLSEWATANERPLPRRSGANWSACCPAHDDHRPSLSVGPGDNYPVVLHCHAGCEPGEVIEALGLSWNGKPRGSAVHEPESLAEDATRKACRIERKPNGGLLIHYDLTRPSGSTDSGVRPRPERRSGPAEPRAEVERGSFADRVASRRVSLVELIERGLPPLDFLPASDEMLVRGKRHMIAAPAKAGKSLAVLVHVIDMILEGANVVIFDRENGALTYAMRLADIMSARRLTPEQRDVVREALAYHQFPSLTQDDQVALALYCHRMDLVVFDSQRMFLSELGLKEDASDDYAAFMAALIDPLFRDGVATLVLDNTGHTDKKRSRGTSSKGDLNEVMFSLQKTADFDLYTTGAVRLKVELTRFGNTGEWTMKLGGGQYSSWQSGSPAKPREDFLAAVVAVLMKVKDPMGMNRLIDEVRRCSVSIGTNNARELLGRYVADPSCLVVQTEAGYALKPALEPGGAAPAPESGGAARRGPEEKP